MEKLITNNLDKYSIDARNWQGIPSIDVDSNGTLFASWYSGGKGEGHENFVVSYISNDGGKSFSGPVAVVAPSGYTRAYDPAVFTGPDGMVQWFWAESEGMYDGRCGVWRSIWDGKTFTVPERLCHGIMMNKPIIASDGRWLLPSAVWNMKPYFGGDKKILEYTDTIAHGCYIYESKDEGKTFTICGKANNPEPSPDEHMVVERKDGSLWMLIRTKYGIGESISTDGGRTWSETKPSSIESPVSRFFIRRLPSGRLILLNHVDFRNADGTVSRRNLCALLSDDDGTTWPYRLLIDERDSVSYPDAAIMENRITVIYDRGRYGDSEILTASFTEDEIISGRLSEADSFIKNIISSRTLLMG